MEYILIAVIVIVLIGLYSIFLLVSSVRSEDDSIILNFFKFGYLTYGESEKEKNKLKKRLAKIILGICFNIRKSSKTN